MSESPTRTTAATACLRQGSVFFQQGCPICGRRLEIDVGLLGRRVYCQHCGGGFVAMDPALTTAAPPSSRADRRVDALLQRAASVLGQTCSDDETC